MNVRYCVLWVVFSVCAISLASLAQLASTQETDAGEKSSSPAKKAGKSDQETTAKEAPAKEQPAEAAVKNAAPVKAQDAELAAVRKASREFVAAFNKGDAAAVAALWTDDGEYINEDGDRFVGHEAIEAQYKKFVEANPSTKMRLAIDRLRLLSDNAALEEGRAFLEPPPAGAPDITQYLVVHVKQNGTWRMSTVRDMTLETPSTYRNLEDLEWLIGTWTSEEKSAKTVSICRWAANKSFVERKYTVTRPDGTETSGIQIIGWNPLLETVQSWNFSSDGGHAVGTWTMTDDGWSADIIGTTGDGIETSATNTLTRLDDGAYVWQSTNRIAGDTPLEDSDEVIMRRSEETETAGK